MSKKKAKKLRQYIVPVTVTIQSNVLVEAESEESAYCVADLGHIDSVCLLNGSIVDWDYSDDAQLAD